MIKTKFFHQEINPWPLAYHWVFCYFIYCF